MDNQMYESQLTSFMGASMVDRPEFVNYYRQPCLGDDTKSTGFDSHYVYHVAWAIRKILANLPVEHTDVSSSINFCTAICSVVPTTFIDFRPAPIHLEGLKCIAGDLTDSTQWPENSYSSLSCMHVVEHIGLGRYGDELGVSGDIVAMTNLMTSLRVGGRLLFVVPVGRPEIYFNAHRVYSATWVARFFSSTCALKEFYFIPGNESINPVMNCDLSFTEQFVYGCGCFEFIRTN